MPNRIPPTCIDQHGRPQSIGITRKRRKIEPQVPSIRAGIFGQWLNGASLPVLADRYGCGVPFIHAVCRSEAQRMREELTGLREKLGAYLRGKSA